MRTPTSAASSLPQPIHDAEQKLIAGRRRQISPTYPGPGPADAENAAPVMELPVVNGQPVSVGLAMAGDGVRGATFALGVLQALASHRLLRPIDYLSTVSGAGYAGAFLGRFFTRFINRPTGAIDMIEARLADASSPEIDWIRRSSDYVAAAAVGESPVTSAHILRAFFTVHALIGMVLVTTFNLANMVRYGMFPWLQGLNLNPLPLDVRLAFPAAPYLAYPWLVLLVLTVVTALLPLATAYWLPSDSVQESYQPLRLIAFLVLTGTGFLVALRTAAWLPALGLPIATGATLFWVERAWSSVGYRLPGATTHPVGRALVRTQLTKWLAIAVTASAVLLAIWLLDEQVTNLYLRQFSLARVLSILVVSAILLLLPLRRLALWMLAGGRMNGREHGFGWRLLTGPYLWPALLGVPLLTGWSFVSHAMFQGGADIRSGAIWTVGTVLAILLLGRSSSVVLVNRSSDYSLAAARASHAYLGASNPFRQVTDVGADVTSPEPDDDLPWERYRPDLAGGPLHLVNVYVNQSLDRVSRRRLRGRQGVNMAIGPVGISLGSLSHAQWTAPADSSQGGGGLTPRSGADRPDPFEPKRTPGDTPLLKTTPLQLSEWIAISGATVPSDPHATTKLGTSLLYTLSNLRTGFWWDSGIDDHEREGQPAPAARNMRQRMGRWFRTQRMIMAELTGRFTGPWQRFWYLSDGSRGDDLGLYELVRRQVPIMICADATRDEAGAMVALVNTMRLARLDFRADIEFLSPAEYARLAPQLPPGVTSALGTLDDLRSEPGVQSRKHAALARVRHHDHTPPSVLLYIKASVTGDEPLEVLEYRRQHPRFPHQSVTSQFLDEAQWESYRLLARHSAEPLFAAGSLQWLADVQQAL